jgi:alpha-tubulin suppressor-like RCC1 family protein
VLPKEVEALRGVDVASVSAGIFYTLALTYTGGVYSWGSSHPNRRLALGHPAPTGGDKAAGDEPTWLPRRIDALKDVRVRCVAAGRKHSCAVTDEGHVYTWGEGPKGALGHMAFNDQWLPKRVEMLYDKGVVAVGVAAGDYHTLVADANGAVWGFGSLNAIGAWNEPTVKQMHGAEDDTVEGVGGLFGGPGYQMLGANGEPSMNEAFKFLYPRGRASISMPVRIPVEVRGPVLAGA